MDAILCKAALVSNEKIPAEVNPLMPVSETEHWFSAEVRCEGTQWDSLKWGQTSSKCV